ncbi:MAG: DHH family phosphoesterase [Patescibacteria group bacterium]|jgi:phosphoesterase RecJ-like protein
MNSVLQEKVEGLIREAGHVLLLTDERIDGDTTGSTLGLYHVLKDLGKQVTVFSPKPMPPQLEFIPGVEVIRRDEAMFADGSIDLAIICDCSDGVYIQKFLPGMKRRVPLVVFDHHATNPMYGTVNIVEPKAASSADVVWRFIKAAKYPVSPNAAQCILTGICTDTGLFSTSNTTLQAITASSELIRLGANLTTIVRHVFINKSAGALKLWGVALERLFFDDTLKMLTTVITKQDLESTKTTIEDIAGVSNFLNAMLENAYDAVTVLYETDDGAVKGSMRSRSRDVAKQAADLFGGGGHKLAAGFKVMNSTLQKQGEKWAIVKKFDSPVAPTLKEGESPKALTEIKNVIH